MHFVNLWSGLLPVRMERKMTDTKKIFKKQVQLLFDELRDHAIGALATCYEGKPYVRSVSCVFLGDNIYFQTDRTMEKAIHMKQTPEVSVCFQHIQIQGICDELKHPLHEQSKAFFRVFSDNYPNAASRYSHMDNERVYRITPTKIETWRYIDGTPYQEIFDIESGVYQMTQYET